MWLKYLLEIPPPPCRALAKASFYSNLFSSLHCISSYMEQKKDKTLPAQLRNMDTWQHTGTLGMVVKGRRGGEWMPPPSPLLASVSRSFGWPSFRTCRPSTKPERHDTIGTLCWFTAFYVTSSVFSGGTWRSEKVNEWEIEIHIWPREGRRFEWHETNIRAEKKEKGE